MSCITEILAIKGDKEILPIRSKKHPKEMRGNVVEGGGHYKDYEFLVTFNDMGFRCGYVAVPEDHPAYNHADSYPDYDVHGGVTFYDKSHIAELILGHTCTDKWIGFDCGHAGDFNDLEQAKKYFGDENRILRGIKISQEIKETVLKNMERDFPGYIETKNSPDYPWKEHKRPKEYVIKECKKLIRQLIKEKEAA